MIEEPKGEQLPSIQESNLKIIDILKKTLKIAGKGRNVKSLVDTKPEQVLEILSEIRENVWTEKKVGKALNFLQKPSTSNFQKVYYPGPILPMVIDLFLNRIGLLGYRIIIDDPLSELAFAHRRAPYWPYIRSDEWISVAVSQALYMVSLESHIRAGKIFFIPPILAWSKELWFKLAEENERYIGLLAEKEIDDCSRHLMYELTADFVLVMIEMNARWFDPTTYPNEFKNVKREDFKNLSAEKRLKIAMAAKFGTCR